MQVVSLFSGIGGFDLASDWMGWKTVVTCEIDPFCQKVLKHYWPNAYHHNDIKNLNIETITSKSTWNPLAATVVVGGFP